MIAHPGAAHLHRYNLLLLVVYYLRINSVGLEILVLSEDWDVPVCLCIHRQTGTYPQYACAYAPSYTGCGLVGEYHGGDASISPRSSIMSKNRTFRTASCLARYFVWANAGQAEII